MTTHGRGALGRWAFGSVADAVTRTSPVPVFVIRPREGDTDIAPIIQRVVVPLDGSPLAEEALPTATSLAQRLHVPAHLVTAIDVTKLLPVEMMPTVAFDASLYEETVAQLEVQATAWLTQTAAQLQHEGVATTWAILHGSPFLAISDAVKPGDVDRDDESWPWRSQALVAGQCRREADPGGSGSGCPRSHGRSKQRGACCWRSGTSGFARFGVDSNAGIRT